MATALVSPNKTQYFPNNTNNSFIKSREGKTASFRIIPNTHLSEEDKMLVESMREE